MVQIFYVLFLVAFFPLLSLANDLTPIEDAVLVCESEGAKIAFQDFNSEIDFDEDEDSRKFTKKNWQADPGEKEGLELKVRRFVKSRRKFHWVIEAKKSRERDIDYRLVTLSEIRSGDEEKIRYHVTLNLFIKWRHEGEDAYQSVLKKVNCKIIEKSSE